MKQKAKSFLVIGMGRFGQHLAARLIELGNEVMVVDKRENELQGIKKVCESIYVGDCIEENTLRSIGVDTFDICFVTMGQDIEASMVITSRLKLLNANYIVAKSSSDLQSDLLKKIGADEVIYPEREHAEKMAIHYNARNVIDYIELTGDNCIYKITVPKAWSGCKLGELGIDEKYQVNVHLINTNMPDNEHIFANGDLMVISGTISNLNKIVYTK
jgi:trk system potassium uptake protein TrkA